MTNGIVRIAGQNFYEDELYHFGVPGMKWGRHLFGKRSSGGKGKSKTKSKMSTVNTKPKKKSVNDMSDDELDKSISRMRKIQTYNELQASLSPQKDAGKSYTSKMKDASKEILLNSYKNIGQQATTYVMGKLTNKIIEGMGGEADAINPKKGQKDK